MEYGKMLDRAYEKLPEKSKERVRFEMPSPESHIQGNKTLVKNFGQIVNAVKRDPKHVLKFITKETGTSATVTEGRLLLNTRFSQEQVRKFFEAYMKRHVLCGECGKPDTRFEERSGARMLKCEACGAVAPAEKL